MEISGNISKQSMDIVAKSNKAGDDMINIAMKGKMELNNKMLKVSKVERQLNPNLGNNVDSRV